ncbi:MAG: V-type ATP synthase subunit E [Methanosarcinales archaeon]|nr:V-type ATP synthase subunit E [Methanosarcinales archaeon]
MGLEDVVNEILEQARSKAAAINARAEEDAATLIREARSRADEIIQIRQAEVDAYIERMRKQEISSAHLEMKRAALNAKKEILDSVYQSAKDAISSIPAEKNVELLKRILDKQGSSGTKVYSNEKDARLIREMTDLIYIGGIDCIGGLIIENDDSTVRMDYTYDRILEDVSEQSLKQISDILFG